MYPDIVVIYKGRIAVLEVKTFRSGRYVYVNRDQYEKLLEFAKRAGGTPYIAVKKVGSGEWFFYSIDMLVETSSGRFRVDFKDAFKAMRLEGFIAVLKGVKKLDEFAK